ncbi:holo-ACP synthase [Alkalicoccus chagannorensis]|uniref:holo-ACP synthase n=1 Tax=Alkalicoccus chagannorensis TaxID=427072 RepID=UPI00041ADED9|nr:holo-ACP synthase [Alkalicoccus chagannorensis]
MIVGTGIDIVEISRIRQAMPRLARRLFTEEERRLLEKKSGDQKAVYAAGRFAAKEAYAKAKGCGIGQKLSFQDIDIQNDPSGRPVMRVRGETGNVHLSISHSREYACAHVLIEEEE